MAAKHVELALSLSQSLSRAFTVVSNGFDSGGLPTVQVGTGSIGSQSAFIRVKAIDSIGTDSVGLTQRAFGPHVIQVALETSTIANVALLTEINKLPLMAEVVGRGARVELYLETNGTAATVSSIDSTKLKATWNGFNREFGLMSAV